MSGSKDAADKDQSKFGKSREHGDIECVNQSWLGLVVTDLVLRQRLFEWLNGSGRDVRAPGARASRPLTIPQFMPDTALGGAASESGSNIFA